MDKNSSKMGQNKPAQDPPETPENPQITPARPLGLENTIDTVLEDIKGGPIRPHLAPDPPKTIDLTPVDGSEDTFGVPPATQAAGIAGPPDANRENTAPFVPCSYFSCSNGHMWPPEIQVAQCPGCKGPVIGVRFRNCPACNEPGLNWTLRHDRIPVRGNDPLPIAAVCRGQEGPAETQLVDFKMVVEKDPECEAPKETK